jgi:hypothetical protein
MLPPRFLAKTLIGNERQYFNNLKALPFIILHVALQKNTKILFSI